MASSGPPANSTATAARSNSIQAAAADWFQSLTGWDAKAYIGEIVATKAEPHREVPLAQACGGWIDWYEGPQSP